MIENGAHNVDFGADRFGFRDLAGINWNLGAPQLYEHALQRNEARVAAHGALVADTGAHTGRSPKDKFVVRDASTEAPVWWDNNNAMSVEHFDALLADFIAHAKGKTLFAQDLYGGADPGLRLRARVFTEYAWHSLFIRNLLIRPPAEELTNFVPELTIVDLPSFRADPKRHGARSETIIACDFTRKIVLIGGTSYAGEMKKSVFTVLNYLLPAKQVMPMHCSANTGKDGDSAIFFGLSGTGKTTLSADPQRRLIGDDEHGWSGSGLLNLEVGCYARCVDLSPEKEPQIYHAIRFGAVLENVVIDSRTGTPDYADIRYTENTRAAYPVEYIDKAVIPGVGGHPSHVLFLAADAFGVLPPIARLNPGQAMYHFLSGYTAKLAGTEAGLGSEPVPEFSTCFASPFIPLAPAVYAKMLGERLKQHNAECWLVNTGWTGGAFGTGERMSLKHTRAMVNAALEGRLDNVEFVTEPAFGLSIPLSCPEVPADLLNPRNAWKDPRAYDLQAVMLAEKFEKNFAKFEAPAGVREAGPVARKAKH